MRGLALAAVCLALAAAAAVLPAAIPNPPAGVRTFGPYAAETANAAVGGACLAWKQHRKRVVRYVWRGGERRRVVRLKRWRTCKRRSAPAPAPAPPPPAAPEPPPVETPPPEDPTLPRLSVKAAEWSYTLSRPEVAAGEVLVELNNAGEDPHNLHVEADGGAAGGSVPTVGPGQQGRVRLALPAGTYRLWCDLDQHAERGMEATLQVTG